MASHSSQSMFRPPINRAMRTLDRAFFRKTIPLAAASCGDPKLISHCRKALGGDVLAVERISSVVLRPGEPDAKKALLLREDITDDPRSWSSALKTLVQEQKVHVGKFDLTLGYEYWTYHDIMAAILPEDEQEELPTGFAIVGHVAHLNLREQFMPYKHLIAQVLLDKTPVIRSVINKIDTVGAESPFRTFQYELLAGDPSLEVTVRESDCVFQFDYSKVYWNSRLNTEHERIINHFQPGEAVCDVMAGIGPFAVPAGKKNVFVWANDLNPDSYKYLVQAIKVNKVSNFVKSFNEDGRAFIRSSTKALLVEERKVDIARKPKSRSTQQPVVVPEYLEQPRVFNHFVMNLPASAITFLDAFVGLYHGHEAFFAPYTNVKLPMIHVHCFSTKSADNSEEKSKICQEISARIGHEIRPDDQEVSIWDVRDVAPQKRMFCASFRLPREVAFHG